MEEPIPVLLEERAAYLMDKPPAPSSGAKVFDTTQEKRVYLCHRPPEAEDPVPVTLMEPVFAQFVDDCQMYKPAEEDYRFVRMLSYEMSSFHHDEHQQMDMFRRRLSSYGIKLEAGAVGSTRCVTDGHLTVENFAVVIAEGKNEIGAGGNDPFAQALMYYHHFIRNLESDKYNVARRRSVFPCFHIIVFGKFV